MVDEGDSLNSDNAEPFSSAHEAVRSCAVRAQQGAAPLARAADTDIDAAILGMAERVDTEQW
jgi:hypothetical protein